MSRGKQQIEFYKLILESIEGTISPERFAILNKIIAEEPGGARDYVEFISINTELCCPGKLGTCIMPTNDESESSSAYDVLLRAMAEYESSALLVESDENPRQANGAPSGHVEKKQAVSPKREISKLAVYSLVLSTAAVVLFMVVMVLFPHRPIIARLTDSINAEWSEQTELPTSGDALRQGEMALVRGLAEITFDDGAVVILEAPATVELQTPNSMYVTSGKANAVVRDYAAGFTINTHSVSIVDLGTEFGVSVGGDGSCSVHMFDGKANIVAENAGHKSGKIVNESEARYVDALTGKTSAIELANESFVRRIDSQSGLIWRGQSLDLTDVVGGGNGFGTGKLGVSINPDTGNIQSGFVWRKGSAVTGKGNYVSMNTPEGVDGVFVPDGGMGDVVVSSMGHVFEECPDTRGHYCWDIYNGNSILEGTVRGTSRHKLDGIEYGTRDNPGLTFHSNAGITFDLDTIRGRMDGCDIGAFKSMCGMADIPNASPDSLNKVQFWVLVDGEVRYKSGPVSSPDLGEKINVKLTEQDRFLTLVVDDAGVNDESIQVDWAMFARPRLIFK